MSFDTLGPWYDLVRRLGKEPDLKQLDFDDALEAYGQSPEVHSNLALAPTMVGDQLGAIAASERELATDVLVRRAKAGSVRAWEALFKKYRTMLDANVRARVPGWGRGRFDTDDVLQVAFGRAMKQHFSCDFGSEASFRRWLATLVVNAWEELEHSGASAVPGNIPSPETKRESNEIYEAIGSLNDEDRDILIQRYFENLSWMEIARIQECSVKQARDLCLQAHGRLTRRIRGR